MRINIAAIGKFKNSSEKDIFHSYIKRIPWQVVLKESETKKHSTTDQMKEAEAALLLASIPKASKIIALDERGKDISSSELAGLIESWQNEGTGSVAFIIGGADGLSQTIRNKADFILSFGKLTWPHMLVRAMLAEQIYRIYSIISGHPYHRG